MSSWLVFLLAFTGVDLGFQSEARRAKNKDQFRRRFDSEDAIWLVAPAKEQLALVTEDRFHIFSFHFRPEAFLVLGSVGKIWRRFICGQAVLRGRGRVNLRASHGGRYGLMVMVSSCGLMVKLAEMVLDS